MAKNLNKNQPEPEKNNPYKVLGLSQADAEVGKTVPTLHQAVSKAAAGAMTEQEQRTFKTWIEGEKYKAISDAAKDLVTRLLAIINGRATELAETRAMKPLPPAPAMGGNRTFNGGTAPASVLGAPFHNPYTFIPFGTAPKRAFPSQLTVDEWPGERARKSGVLSLTIRTMSPLLTCSPTPNDPKANHKEYPVLAIGDDVIVPASGVRGSLRTLMTILTGGTLGYVDEELFLTQGRDVNLGPRGKSNPENTPTNVFLAEVLQPGSSTRSGEIQLGKTLLFKAELLHQIDDKRPKQKSIEHVWAKITPDTRDTAGLHGVLGTTSSAKDDTHCWKLKLSGLPINPKGKREGAFLANGAVIEIPANYWRDYQGRNRHGDHPELRAGDLVWLELSSPELTKIDRLDQIVSLQWARWGRKGEKLKVCIKDSHTQVLPDSLNSDGMVDEVTDLFGQIPIDPKAAGPFASRIRPENLVFMDAAKKAETVTLAPLQSPHPGCIAFYRDIEKPAEAGPKSKLRGYKVYRNTKERGAGAPWLFSTQGVYGDHGELKDPKQEANKTCDLVPQETDGTLRIAFRALSQREFALLVMACTVDWRLGGGKPLGLGHCRVIEAKWIDEDGDTRELFKRTSESYPANAVLPEELKGEVSDLEARLQLWHASQEPVEKLRYPRAVKENRQKLNRGGHVWFGRHASMRKSGTGLEVLRTTGELKRQAGESSLITPQLLPVLNPNNPQSDLLFGHDLISEEKEREVFGDRTTQHSKLEPFDPKVHSKPTHQSGGNQSQNRETRQSFREGRD